jgi:hypothetical protein
MLSFASNPTVVSRSASDFAEIAMRIFNPPARQLRRRQRHDVFARHSRTVRTSGFHRCDETSDRRMQASRDDGKRCPHHPAQIGELSRMGYRMLTGNSDVSHLRQAVRATMDNLRRHVGESAVAAGQP